MAKGEDDRTMRSLSHDEVKTATRLLDERRVKRGDEYIEIIRHLPGICLVAHEEWRTERGAHAIRHLWRFLVVEVKEFLGRWPLSKEVVDEHGKVLLGAVDAMTWVVGRVGRDDFYLNVFWALHLAIHAQSAVLWEKASVRALADMAGVERAKESADDLRGEVLLGLALGRLPERTRRLVHVVVERGGLLDPDQEIPGDVFEDAYRVLLEAGDDWKSADNCRKQFRAVMRDLRTDTDWLFKVTETAITWPDT
jgi:hypothetical protein